MTDSFTLPVPGWADEWASYDMQVIGAVVAFIRDHGPVADERVLSVIRRTGFGGDVRKASPDFDERDGAQRILNLLIFDVDAIVRTPDGLLSVEPGTTSVMSTAKGLKVVPSADAKAADAAKARHTEQLRRWVFKSPFATDWRDGIRQHDETTVVEMAYRIEAVGYVGPYIVCDQFGVIIDGHLRYAALRVLGINPDRYTETLTFDNDMHRLAYVIAVHQQGKHFPADLKNAIVAYINTAAARSGEKVLWPADIPTIVGTGHQPPSSTRRKTPPPVVPEPPPAPVEPVVADPDEVIETEPDVTVDDDGLYRPPFSADKPGRGIRSGAAAGIAQSLVDASTVPDRWVPRDHLRGQGSAKFDFVLRRTGWFMFNGDGWLFIPDRLDGAWTKARVRRLNPVEIGNLQDAFKDDHHSYWDEWAYLITKDVAI
jgi:hypothetical protein